MSNTNFLVGCGRKLVQCAVLDVEIPKYDVPATPRKGCGLGSLIFSPPDGSSRRPSKRGCQDGALVDDSSWRPICHGSWPPHESRPQGVPSPGFP